MCFAARNGEKKISVKSCTLQPKKDTLKLSNYVRNGERKISMQLCVMQQYADTFEVVKLCKRRGKQFQQSYVLCS